MTIYSIGIIRSRKRWRRWKEEEQEGTGAGRKDQRELEKLSEEAAPGQTDQFNNSQDRLQIPGDFSWRCRQGARSGVQGGDGEGTRAGTYK